MSSIKDIKSHMKGYQFIDLAATDVHLMMQHYKDLKPGVEDYTHMHGHKNDHKKQLFCLRGTIPVVYRGSNYNIPIVVWLQKTHPQDSPIVYVTPIPDMRINPSRYVDGNGRVYLPYLTEWTLGENDLLTLIQILSATFADYIPVYEFTNQQSSNLEQRRNSAGNEQQHDLLALEQQRHREEIDVLQHQIGALLEHKIANEKWSTRSPSTEDLRKDWEEEKVVLTSQVKAYSRQCEELKKTLFRIQEESKCLQEEVNHKSRIQFEVDDLKTQLQSEVDSKAYLMSSLRREQQRVLDLEEKLAVYIKEYSKLQEANRAMQDELQTLNDQFSKLISILPPEYLRILHIPHHQHKPFSHSSEDTRREYKQPFIPNQHFIRPNVDRSSNMSPPELLSGSDDPPLMTASQLQQFAKQAQQQREQVIPDLQQEEQESLKLLEEQRRRENLLAEKALQELEKAERERIKKQGNRKVSPISKGTPTNYYLSTSAESGGKEINQMIEGTSEVIDNTNISHNMPENPLLENIDQDIQYYADQVLDMTKHSTTATEEVEDSNYVYCGKTKGQVLLTEEVRQDYYKMMQRPSTKEVQEDNNSSLPYDPNLVCHKCGRRYRIGEIQKFKRHIKELCPMKQ